jgi:hypothetical protein
MSEITNNAEFRHESKQIHKPQIFCIEKPLTLNIKSISESKEIQINEEQYDPNRTLTEENTIKSEISVLKEEETIREINTINFLENNTEKNMENGAVKIKFM